MVVSCLPVARSMQVSQLMCTSLVLLAVVGLSLGNDDKKEGEGKKKKLQIGVKKRVDPEQCKVKSKKGDVLHMHYTVRLQHKHYRHVYMH